MYAKRNIMIKSLFFIPVIFIYTAIFILTISFTQYYYVEEPFSLSKIFVSICFYTCLIMAILNHILTMFTEPGIVEETKCAKYTDQELKEFQQPEKRKSFFKYYCKKCKIVRPERSHHCKTCKRCVLKLDEHCPWMFNCIGLNNQKFYYLFLFYSLIGITIVLCTLIYKVLNYELTPKDGCNDGVFLLSSFKKLKFMGMMINNEFFVILMQVYCNVSDGIHMALIIVLCIFLLLVTVCNFETQTLLIISNKTRIESIRLKKHQYSPYYFNDKIKNFKCVLGDSIYRWFLPIVDNVDGYNFPKPNLENFMEIENKNNSKKRKIDL